MGARRAAQDRESPRCGFGQERHAPRRGEDRAARRPPRRGGAGLEQIEVATGPQRTGKIAGVGCGDAKARGSLRLARRLGVASRIDWLGPRDDIPALMAAADLLVHPARQETTGQVILEALALGLPVVTTAVCGFAEHVARADAGVVLPPRFDADRLAAALASAGDAALRARWSQRAIAYVAAHDVTGGFEQAAEFIEQVAGEHARRT